MFFKKDRNIIGLDIGSREIKAVELENCGGTYRVTQLACKTLVGDQPKAEALRQVMRETSFHTNRVVTAVSGRSVIVRYISMQLMNDADLKTAIHYEADKYIPFGLDEVVIDCARLPIENEPHAAPNEMKILLVAVKRQVVEEHVAMLREANLEPLIVDIDSFALGNAFELASELNPRVEEPKIVGLVDIGGAKTNINIMVGKTSYFTREVYLGGNDLTNAIAKRRGVGQIEAENLKTEPTVTWDEINEDVGLALDDLGNEIQLSLDYFENQFETEVGEVLLTGGTSTMKGLEQALGATFQKPTRLWNPLESMPVANTAIPAEYIRRVGPQMAVALGLASRLRKEPRR
jgi:type IV pilus assembly protein PilM